MNAKGKLPIRNVYLLTLYISLLAGLMVASLPLGAFAGSEGKDQGEGWCGLHGNYKGASCLRCREPGGPAINHEAVRLNEWNRRFNVLLNQLRVYDVPNVDDLYGAAAPATNDELHRRVDRLYVETAFHKSRRYWKYEENARELVSLPASLSALHAENLKLDERLATAPERLKDAEAQRDRNMARAEAEERVARWLRNNTEIVEDHFFTAKGNVTWAIYELLPADRKVAFIGAMRKCCEAAFMAYAKQKLQEPLVLQVKQPEPAELIAESVDRIGPRRKPSPMTGSIESKFSAIEELKKVLGDVSSIIPSQEKRLAVLEEQGAELRQNKESLLRRVQTWESPLEKAQALADAAERRVLTALVNQEISASNLLKLAAAVVSWNHIKNTVVIPQIEQILEENGLLHGLKGMAMIDRIRKSPQEFLPKVGPLKDLARLIETEKKVLSIEEDFQSYSLAAVDATAQVGTAESDRLAAAIFYNVEKKGIDIMRVASGRIEGPLGRIAQALMERAPKE